MVVHRNVNCCYEKELEECHGSQWDPDDSRCGYDKAMFRLIWEVKDISRCDQQVIKQIEKHNECNDTEFRVAFSCNSGAHISIAAATGLETLLKRQYSNKINIDVESLMNSYSKAWTDYDNQQFRSDGKNDDWRMDIINQFNTGGSSLLQL